MSGVFSRIDGCLYALNIAAGEIVGADDGCGVRLIPAGTGLSYD